MKRLNLVFRELVLPVCFGCKLLILNESDALAMLALRPIFLETIEHALGSPYGKIKRKSYDIFVMRHTLNVL